MPSTDHCLATDPVIGNNVFDTVIKTKNHQHSNVSPALQSLLKLTYRTDGAKRKRRHSAA